MSLRALQRRVTRIEAGRKPRQSPIAAMYGSFDTFVDVSYASRDTVQFVNRPGTDLQGFVEPDRWDYDGCVRREPVMDMDYPHGLVRKIGWQRCLKCRRPFLSEDVIRQRPCTRGNGMVACRGDEDRFT